MKKKKTGGQKSRLRVDPFILAQRLYEKHVHLSEVQKRTGFDPAELEPMRTAHKIHLDTLNRLAAGLNVPPNSLLITPYSMFSLLCSKQEEIGHIVMTGYDDSESMDTYFDEWDEDDPPEDNPLYL